MNIIKIKNHVSGSLSSLGLTVRKATTINQDAAEYILVLTNLLEQNENIPMNRAAYSVLTMDILCTGKSEEKNQEVMGQVYDLFNSSDFQKSFSTTLGIPVSTITCQQIAEDTDPTSGINTLMITISMNYLNR